MMAVGVDTQVMSECTPEMTDMPELGRMKVDKKPRKYVYLHGYGDHHELFCHNNSRANLVRALHERVFRVKGPNGLVPPPQPKPKQFDTIGLMLQPHLRQDYVPMTDREFLNQVPAQKRRVYEAAVKRYHQHGLYSKQCCVSAFVKFEKQVVSESKPDPAPRVIQSRSPVYHYRLGRYTRRIEHDIYDAISKVWSGPTVMKGMTPDQVAECMVEAWNSFTDPMAISLDASRFDQHVSADALKWEHKVYKHCFPDEDELVWLLKQQVHNVGYGEYPGGQIKYKTNGCRMSGDMNTGLGNCIIMCCMMKKYVDSLSVRARLINNGDDCVLIVEREHVDRILETYDQFFLDLGFEMGLEAEPTDVLEKIPFCQLRLINTGHGWTMVRELKAIVKDAACLCPAIDGVQSWMGAVGECGMALAGDIPIYGAMYSSYMRNGKSGNVTGNHNFRNTGMAIAMRGMARHRYGEPTDQCRVSFYRAFGISPTAQLEYERYYTSLKSGELATGFSLHTVYA